MSEINASMIQLHVALFAPYNSASQGGSCKGAMLIPNAPDGVAEVVQILIPSNSFRISFANKRQCK